MSISIELYHEICLTCQRLRTPSSPVNVGEFRYRVRKPHPYPQYGYLSIYADIKAFSPEDALIKSAKHTYFWHFSTIPCHSEMVTCIGA